MGVTMTVNKGDFLVITGESGSGKSSLCMAMTGAIPHYFGGVMKGMVYVNGQATTQTTISQLAARVGAMLDDYDSQLVAMTVEEEIAFSLENQGVAPDKSIRLSRKHWKSPHAALSPASPDQVVRRPASASGHCRRLGD